MPRKRPCFSSSNHSKLALRQEKALKIRTDWEWTDCKTDSDMSLQRLANRGSRHTLLYSMPDQTDYHTTHHQVWGDQYLNINMIKERIFIKMFTTVFTKARNKQIKTGLGPSEMRYHVVWYKDTVSREHPAAFFRVEDGGSRFLRNVRVPI